MPNFLRIMRQFEEHIDALAGYRQPDYPSNPVPPSRRPGGELYTRTCAFCGTVMKGERCKNCGAPVPGEIKHEQQHHESVGGREKGKKA